MKRRSLLLSSLALAGLPQTAIAQSPRVFRIGWLIGGSADGSTLFLEALRAGLADHGYVEGRNLVIERRYGEDRPEPAVAALAHELADLPVDVLVTQGYATRTVIKETRSLPVVYVFSADPVLSGIAQSLARPGGNATGISLMSVELNGKRIELLHEMLPRLAHVTVLANPAHSGANFELQACESAGQQLGIAVSSVLVRNAAELEESFAELASGKPGAINVLPDGLVIQKRQRIVQFAAAERVPVISGWRIFAESGALCTYGPRLTESYRRAGFYIDRILKGAKPTELPIERPTVFELTVNLKTAKALDIAVPQSVLARADDLIE